MTREEKIKEIKKKVLEIIEGGFLLLEKQNIEMDEDFDKDLDWATKYFRAVTDIYLDSMKKDARKVVEGLLDLLFPILLVMGHRNRLSQKELLSFLENALMLYIQRTVAEMDKDTSHLVH